MMAWILLQGSLPVSLGPLGTLIVTGLAVILAGLNAYQWRRSGEADSLRGQVTALNGELNIVRERSNRLTDENIELAKVAGELRAKTDLSKMQRQTQEFESKNQEVHERIVRSLDMLTEKGSVRYESVIETISENTKGLYDLGDKMSQEFELHRKAFSEMTKTLHSIDVSIRNGASQRN